jgi:hypothetical protein
MKYKYLIGAIIAGVIVVSIFSLKKTELFLGALPVLSVPQGGTGTSTLSTNFLISSGATATSSLQDTLITWLNNNIGLSSTSPWGRLSVQGITGATTYLMSLASSSSETAFNIKSDGTVRLIGDATAFEDLRFPATAINPVGAPSPMTFDSTNLGFTASAAGTTSIAVIAQLPHSWKTGSSIYPHVHWEPTTTDTGNVVWNIEYKWTSTNETEPATFEYIQTTQAGSGTAFTHQLASLPSISGTGETLSSILSIKISRGGSSSLDTYADDALLKEFDIHYEVDSFGSDREVIKTY